MKTKIMTPAEFEEKMKSHSGEAPDEAHDHMDREMCSLLKSLGYGEGIQIFVEQEKWYA